MNPSTGLVLYTTADRIAETNWLTQFLQRNRCVFTTTDATDAATYQLLVDRFGKKVELPGIVLDDCIWIPSDAENLMDLVHEYVVDKLLCQGQDANNKETNQKARIPNGQDITQLPPHLRTTARAEPALPPTRDGVRIVGPAVSHPGARRMALPGHTGTTWTVTELTRQLLAVTPHSLGRVDASPKASLYFRGSDGMVLWKQLFSHVHATDQEWIRFGRVLVEYGILHCYTSLDGDFGQAYLVVGPLREPRSLNTLIAWPSAHVTNDATSLMLRLSEQMDEMVRHPMVGRTDWVRHPLFAAWEEAVCELQGVSVPSEPQKNAAFALNLHNVMVRHAMMLSTSSQNPSWTWPTSLDELSSFAEKIGYTVGHEFLSLSQLRVSLLKCHAVKPVVTATQRPWYTLPRLCQPHSSGDYFGAPTVQSDVRLVMAMAWGTRTSPVTRTVYPDGLEAGLQAAAEHYCRTRVSVQGGSRVELPALLSWFRVDFGTTPAAVLRHIQGYLSMEQKQALLQQHPAGGIQTVFCPDHPQEWKFDWSAHAFPVDSRPEQSPVAMPKNQLQSVVQPTQLVAMESITDASLFTSIGNTVCPSPVANAKGKVLPVAPPKPTFESVAVVDIEISRSLLPPKDLKPSSENKHGSYNAHLHRQRMAGLGPSPTTLGHRQESRGDSMLFIPGRQSKPRDGDNSASTVATKNTRGPPIRDATQTACWQPHLHATVSAMTFGSEFNLIVQSAAVTKGQVVHRTPCAVPLYTL